MKNTDQFHTLDEVATILRVDRATVARWIADGALPAVRTPGGRFRIAKEDVHLALKPARRRPRDDRPTEV